MAPKKATVFHDIRTCKTQVGFKITDFIIPNLYVNVTCICQYGMADLVFIDILDL